MNATYRQFGLVALLTGTVFAGGCAVYATPGDVGVAVVPPPVVVGPPPVVVRPYPYYGYYGYRPAPRAYPRYAPPPRYAAPRYSAPRYSAPGYSAPGRPVPRYQAPR